MKFQHVVRATMIGSMVVMLGAGSAFAEKKADAPAKGAPPKMDAAGEAAMMAEAMKMAAPGPEHKVLEASVGNWKTVSKAWMGPGEPQISEGSASYEMILGGRFQVGRFHGSMMGMPFEGYGVTGYNKMTKSYEGYWMDTMGTMMYPMPKGTWDEASKTLSFDVVWPEAMTGGTAPYTLATKFDGADKMVFTITGTHEGKTAPMMEVTYNRVK